MPKALRRIAVSAQFLCVYAVMGVSLVAALVVPTQASAARPAYERAYLDNYAEAHDRSERLGLKHPGCNLVTNRYENRCQGKTTKREVVKSNETLKRMLYVPPPPQPVSSSQTTPAAPAATASSGSGTYCGLFQFDQSTWESVGGSGSPCAASPGEQWARAEELQRERGNQPWPKCGAGGASLEEIMQCESSGNPQAVGG